MRLQTLTSTATFQKLDERVNDEDSFANVRDLLALRANHNALISRRMKRSLIHFTGRIPISIGVNVMPYHDWSSVGGSSARRAALMMDN